MRISAALRSLSIVFALLATAHFGQSQPTRPQDAADTGSDASSSETTARVLRRTLIPDPAPQRSQIPAALTDWREWVLWRVNTAPPLYSQADLRPAAWPSTLRIDATDSEARFEFSVRVYFRTSVRIPGSLRAWPDAVVANGRPVPVLERDSQPAVLLEPGLWTISGRMAWAALPQQIAIPGDVGIVRLTVRGEDVPAPAWDANSGQLWLQRDRVSEEADKDFIDVQMYRLIEDGIPMWLRTQVDLVVSGKSREEQIGAVLPEGWRLAGVRAPIPVFVDDRGELRAQVRPGRWTVQIDAFRIESPETMGFADGLQPAAQEELVGFRAKPDLRLVEIPGLPVVDITQTNYPSAWRENPVYLWETGTPFSLVERQRGAGMTRAPGVRIFRQLWLDGDGRAFTTRDTITGERQEIWRLDAAGDLQPGSVEINGVNQLITKNPLTDAPGVEVRARSLNLTATGRMERDGDFSASGWDVDADGLTISMMLPPGWRALMVRGPDSVTGQWLTEWSLLDLFLLLVFSFAVFKLWGPLAGVLAFLAFAAAYHEPGAPRYIWLALLPPLALLRVVKPGTARQLVQVWKWAAVLVLASMLIPFLSRQTQQMIYPQLELVPQMSFGGDNFADFARGDTPEDAISAPSETAARAYAGGFAVPESKSIPTQSREWNKSNLAQAAGARIQTGPGVPEWRWREVLLSWNGPVTSDQQVDAILVPVGVERVLTAFRIVLLLALAALLLDVRKVVALVGRKRGVVAAAILLAISVGPTHAQIPNQELRDELRERLTAPPDAFPNAATIASTAVTIRDREVTMQSTVHAGAECAVPLPGRLPDWSPVTVTVNGQPAEAIGRRDGFLWIVVPEGVHDVAVTGRLSDSPDWEWTFVLKPNRVAVDAPDWTVTGLNADGVPEAQVFFSRTERGGDSSAGYDRQDVDAVVLIERSFEIGLVWQVQTTVRRLSPEGRAIELRIPLLPGERVLDANLVVNGDTAEVRLGSNTRQVIWSSELAESPEIALTAGTSPQWVERWKLTASPVWNIAFDGLEPIYEANAPELVPVWTPWPGESVTWKINRPEAERGPTVTVNRANTTIAVGSRQRTGSLDLGLVSSLGEEFGVRLPEGAEVTGLRIAGNESPIRIENDRLVFPLRPGALDVQIAWRENVDAGFAVRAGAVVLSADAANVRTVMQVPEDRWVLWTAGPLRGPAVRFWIVLVVALVAGWLLGSVPGSPLRRWQWMLLSLGFTQVPLAASIVVVGWLFLLVWRGHDSFRRIGPVPHNLLQVVIAGATAAALMVFLWIVGAGLLGDPRMFILGNGSTATSLQWFADRTSGDLPRPAYFSISIWWYRLLMLLWALWLAASLVRWLWWGWTQFSRDAIFRIHERPPKK